MSETTFEWLKTIDSGTSLGAGMATAQKDLKTRGADNLLDGEQSGHIASIGFDLYVCMVGEAVAAYDEEGPAEDTAVDLETPVDTHIPEDYLGAQSLRLDTYTCLPDATLDGEIDQLLDEMNDRYERPSSSI